jgi:hypothetical protein
MRFMSVSLQPVPSQAAVHVSDPAARERALFVNALRVINL